MPRKTTTFRSSGSLFADEPEPEPKSSPVATTAVVARACRDPEVILRNLKDWEQRYLAWSKDSIAWKGNALCGLFATAFGAEHKRCQQLLKAQRRVPSTSNRKTLSHPQAR